VRAHLHKGHSGQYLLLNSVGYDPPQAANYTGSRDLLREINWHHESVLVCQYQLGAHHSRDEVRVEGGGTRALQAGCSASPGSERRNPLTVEVEALRSALLMLLLRGGRGPLPLLHSAGHLNPDG